MVEAKLTFDFFTEELVTNTVVNLQRRTVDMRRRVRRTFNRTNGDMPKLSFVLKRTKEKRIGSADRYFDACS